MRRFSKTVLSEYLDLKIQALENTHGFDPHAGWDQVKHDRADVAGDDGYPRPVAYGMYEALRGVREDFDL